MKLPRVLKTNRGKLDLGEMAIVRRRFIKYVKPHWKALLISFLATIGAVAANIAAPWPIKLVFDLVLGDAMASSTIGLWFARLVDTKTGALAIICGLILVIAIAEACFAYFRDVLLAKTGQDVVGRIRQDLFRHMQKLSPDVFESRRTGDLLMRLTGDIRMLRQMMVNAWITAGENVLTIVTIAAVMFWLNPLLAAVALCAIPLIGWSTARISKRIRHVTKSQREKESFIASIAHEVLGAMMVVQAFNREKVEAQRFARQNRSSIRAGVRATRLEAKLFRIVSLSTATGLCAVLFLGVRSVLDGAMTPGDLLLFVAYVRAVNKPLRKLSKLASQTAKATTCGMRIVEILRIPPAIKDAPDAVATGELRGDIELANVSFAYPDGTPALSEVSVRIGAGERVAVVGRSGAGKSTLMKLLLRFYDADEGSVRFDGKDIRGYMVASLRDQIAIVQQDTVLFGLTISENIALGCDGADKEEIRAAAKAVGAHSFIRSLPEKYETRLSEKGTTLSGGQRQRIALARALLRRSPILLLDEPITGLDAASAERAESSWMVEETARTTVVICHDLSAMERFDRVFVLDRGRLIDTGTHELLVERCAVYGELHEAWRARSVRSELMEDADDAHESRRLAV